MPFSNWMLRLFGLGESSACRRTWRESPQDRYDPDNSDAEANLDPHLAGHRGQGIRSRFHARLVHE